MKHCLVVALVAATAGFVSCAQEDDVASSTKDISIPDNNGSHPLLWIAGGEIFEGTCPSGALPVRANCTEAIRSSGLDGVVSQVTSQIASDRDAQVALRVAEVSRLKNADPTVQSMRTQLSALARQISDLGLDLEAQYVDASATELEIGENETLNAQYTEQLTALEAALTRDPDNIELRRLQIALTDEQSEVMAELAHQIAHLTLVKTQIATGEAELSAAELEHGAMSQEFEAYFEGLEVGSETLDRINATVAELDRQAQALEGVLAKLADSGIAYRSQLLNPAQTQVLVRLKAGFAPANARIEQGVLQVRYNEQWRGVCDDSFDRRDASVACRMMGLTLDSFSIGARGPSGNFWLDDLRCNGDEESLFDCGHNGIGRHDCSASEHVALVCR